jgi:hypothetical protein
MMLRGNGTLCILTGAPTSSASAQFERRESLDGGIPESEEASRFEYYHFELSMELIASPTRQWPTCHRSSLIAAWLLGI